MIFGFSYATPSVFESARDRALLGFAANAARKPVRFHARIKDEIFLLRTALRALGEAIWSEDSWVSRDEWLGSLDPIITVHPDRVSFEAFSGDQGAYVALHVDRTLFAPEGEIITGTTNIDFTAWLWAALAEMRSSRETWLRVGPEGFEVTTVAAGGRFEKKVDVPDAWVRGFLQTQAAMAMPGTALATRPVDILAAIRWLRYSKARVSPRGMRYIFEPGRDVRLVLEPWEKEFPLAGCEHQYTEPRIIRVWGRRKLKLIEPLLPFAERVDVFLKGRGLPSFYAVKLPAMTFVLGVGGTPQGFRGAASLELMGNTQTVSAELLERIAALLAKDIALTGKQAAAAAAVSLEEAQAALQKLCRLGRAMFDVEARQFRHRELFAEPVDEARLYPPDPRIEQASALLREGAVQVRSCHAEETKKTKSLKTSEGRITREIVYRDWRVQGSAGPQADLELVVNHDGRMIFGRCACEFFKEHLMSRGPCEHLLALFRASEPMRSDLPVSTAAPEAKPTTPRDGKDDESVDDDEGDR